MTDPPSIHGAKFNVQHRRSDAKRKEIIRARRQQRQEHQASIDRIGVLLLNDSSAQELAFEWLIEALMPDTENQGLDDPCTMESSVGLIDNVTSTAVNNKQ